MTVDELAALVGGRVSGGDGSSTITGPATLAEAAEGHIAFFGNPKYLPLLKRCRATAVLVPLDFEERLAAIQIKVENPSLAFATVVEKFSPEPIIFPPGIHPSSVIGEGSELGAGVSIQPHAVIEPGARIGAGTLVGANSYVGHDVSIGERCRIYPNVVIREGSRIGNRVILHSGAVIGSDGFGFEMQDGQRVKIPQIGIVQIDDDVEIGANTTIDRARFGRTWIQEGTKIDNLVQIAHNVIIGRNSIIIAQTGISGSSKLGHSVTLAGQVGVVGHIEIGEGAIVGAQSGVSKNVPSKETWLGSPAVSISEQKERFAMIARLGKLYERVKRLEQLLDSKGKSSPEES